MFKKHHRSSSVARLAGVLLLVTVGFAVRPVVAQQMLAITGARIETVSPAGTLEDATLLIKDGKIEAVGEDVKIPVAAKIVDASGKTILPGIVDPYYVVTIGRNASSAATRTIVFRGRTFVIPGSPAIATTFAKVADGLDVTDVDWQPARRSGITTMHVVTGGYAQSLIAEPGPELGEVEIQDDSGDVLVTVSNETKSLNVLRTNLKPPSSRSGSSGRGSSNSSARSGSAATESSAPAAGRSAGATAGTGSTVALWKEVREGKSPLFINVDNASAVLHADAIVSEYPKAKIVLIATGENVFLTLQSLEAERYSVILPPRIDDVPNSADRINVPKLLADKKFKFAFSLSLGQSDFRTHQPTPLVGVAMLVRAGLERDPALQALTIEPARILGLEKEIGSLEVGKRANLIVFDEDPLSATAGIEQVYVDGQPLEE